MFAQFNAVCAGTMMAIGKEVTREIPPQMFVALMYTILIPVNAAWWALTHFGIIGKLHSEDSARSEHALEPKALLWLVAHTGGSAVGIIGLWEGLALSSAATGSLLSRIEVVIAIILGLWLLREHFTKWHWLGFGLTVVGMVIVRWAELSASPEAFSWLLLGAVGFGFAEFSGKIAVLYWPVPRLMLLRGFLMWAILTTVWWIRTPWWPWEAHGTYPGLTMAGLGWLVASAILGPVLARNNYMLAMSYLPVSQVVLLTQLQPLYAALIGWWLRGEVPAPWFYAGAAAIILGNAVLVRSREVAKRG